MISPLEIPVRVRAPPSYTVAPWMIPDSITWLLTLRRPLVLLLICTPEQSPYSLPPVILHAAVPKLDRSVARNSAKTRVRLSTLRDQRPKGRRFVIQHPRFRRPLLPAPGSAVRPGC